MQLVQDGSINGWLHSKAVASAMRGGVVSNIFEIAGDVRRNPDVRHTSERQLVADFNLAFRAGRRN